LSTCPRRDRISSHLGPLLRRSADIICPWFDNKEKHANLDSDWRLTVTLVPLKSLRDGDLTQARVDRIKVSDCLHHPYIIKSGAGNSSIIFNYRTSSSGPESWWSGTTPVQTQSTFGSLVGSQTNLKPDNLIPETRTFPILQRCRTSTQISCSFIKMNMCMICTSQVSEYEFCVVVAQFVKVAESVD